MKRCDITDLLESDCAHCRRLPDLDAEVPRELGSYFVARFDSRCSGCKEPVWLGDRIRSDGTSFGYLGECCGGDA